MNQIHKLMTLGCFAAAGALASGDAWSTPRVQQVSIDCATTTNNDGCERAVTCPSGTRVLSAVAACNLEYGPVTDEQLASVPVGHMKVVRRSDHVEEGNCW